MVLLLVLWFLIQMTTSNKPPREVYVPLEGNHRYLYQVINARRGIFFLPRMVEEWGVQRWNKTGRGT